MEQQGCAPAGHGERRQSTTGGIGRSRWYARSDAIFSCAARAIPSPLASPGFAIPKTLPSETMKGFDSEPQVLPVGVQVTWVSTIRIHVSPRTATWPGKERKADGIYDRARRRANRARCNVRIQPKVPTMPSVATE